MTVEVRHVDDPGQWDRYVERSPAATFFHTADVLSLQAEHAGATLHRLAGFKGEEPVGVFPLFELRKGMVPGLFSPPPYLLVSYLGPALLNQETLSARKAERRNRAFVRGCLDRVAEATDPWFVQIKTPVGYDDVRPFKWAGYDAVPSYTYHVDLSTEDPLMRFSSDARRNITGSYDVEYVIREGDHEAIGRIAEHVERRYRSQGQRVSVPSPFVAALGDRLEGGQVRPYVCRVEGEFASGIVALEHGDVVYRWLGGATPEIETDLPINDLLDWAVMRRSRERGVRRYDLVGAGDARINRYKAKFNPELRAFYRVQSGSGPVTALVDAYKRLVGSKWFSPG